MSVGDLIWFNEGTQVGIISEILSDENLANQMGLDDIGIFICIDILSNKLHNDVFNPESLFINEGIEELDDTEKEKVKSLYKRLLAQFPSTVSYKCCRAGKIVPSFSDDFSQPYWMLALFNNDSSNEQLFIFDEIENRFELYKH